MKIGEIVSLLKAGYTKAEIQELRAAESAPVEPEVPVPVSPESAADAAPEPVPAPEAAPAVKEKDPEIEELKNLVSNLTKLVQQQNIRNSAMPAPKSQEQTAEDILATIINPKEDDK